MRLRARSLGLVQLACTDQTVALQHWHSRARLVLCTDSLSRDMMLNVLFLGAAASCQRWSNRRNMSPAVFCMGGVWLCCNIQVLGSGFPASMMGWTPLTSEFLKNISPSIPVNAGMQASGPLWVCSVSCSTDANGSLCQDVWLCTAQMLLLNSSKFSKTAWSSLASCPCSCTQAVSPSGPNAEAES